jgi:hypothetical protein
MDSYRDRLHSKLFNYLKSITYDERDPRFDAAQRLMRLVKAAGNPTKLAENAESAMLTALRDKLDAHRDDVVAAGAQDIADALATANLQFIALERECRRFAAAQPAGTQSMGAARKQSDPAYTAIVNAINSYADLPSKKEYYGDAIAEINALALKYEAALSARHGKKSETAKAEPEKA